MYAISYTGGIQNIVVFMPEPFWETMRLSQTIQIQK